MYFLILFLGIHIGFFIGMCKSQANRDKKRKAKDLKKLTENLN